MYLDSHMKRLSISLVVAAFFLCSDALISQHTSWLLAGVFWLLILFVTLFYQRYLYLYALLLIFGMLHWFFFSYFQRPITSVDIHLFLTHTEESWESFYSMIHLFVLPLILFLTGVIIMVLLSRVHLTPYPLKGWIKHPLLLLLVFLNLNSSMGLQLLSCLCSLPSSPSQHNLSKAPPLYPQRESDYHIVLILGESMKYSKEVASKLHSLGFFHKKIHAGATNTDVAIPLLLNHQTNPLALDPHDPNQLFALAQRNRFKTSFVSIQTPKSLQYILPYLQPNHLDYCKCYSKEERKPLFDLRLMEALQETDWQRKNFIVLQQIGEHSPYHYFAGTPSPNPLQNYTRSIEYSFKLYQQIYAYLQTIHQKFILIYVSDHGEFTGEGGHWGHNSFDPIVYEVPMFIIANIPLPSGYQAIRSQYDLSGLLIYLLGYGDHLQYTQGESIVNGTMLSREDGFIRVK